MNSKKHTNLTVGTVKVCLKSILFTVLNSKSCLVAAINCSHVNFVYSEAYSSVFYTYVTYKILGYVHSDNTGVFKVNSYIIQCIITNNVPYNGT